MRKIFSAVSLLAISLFALVGGVSAKTQQFPKQWYLKGNYTLVFTLNGSDFTHKMVIDTTNTETGEFTGHGFYVADPTYTWNVNGQITNSDINFHIVYTGTNSGYTLDAVGTVASDGKLSGTATSNQGQSFTWKATSGKAVRFTGNHGQWVRFSTNKKEAAKSRTGMPVNSKGHVKEEMSENHSDD